MADCMTVTSLSASFLQKVSAAMDRLSQIALNWKLLRKFKIYINLQVALKRNHAKRNPVKRDLPVPM